MKNFLKQILSENGTISSVRFMAITCVFSAAACAFYGIYTNKDLVSVSVLCGVFLSAAFGGKVGQKFAENKSEKE